MDKPAVLAAIRAALTDEIARHEHASRDNAAAATDEQNRSEDKYDTRGLEASYLAHGQAKMVVELREQLTAYLALRPPAFGPEAQIALGALVALEARGRTSLYFLGPAAGGLEVRQGHRTITVVTPSSPIGRQLIGKRLGAEVTLRLGGVDRPHRVAALE